MAFTRREFGKLALASVPAAALFDAPVFGQTRPDSLINGVQIGAITYSYRSMPDQSAEAMLRYIVESGISAVELMGGPIESYAGAPAAGRGGGGGGRGRQAAPASGVVGAASVPAPGAAQETPPAAAQGRQGGGRGRGQQQTPEEQAAQQRQQAALKAWRLSQSMDKFKALRTMFNNAGVTVYATKMLNGNMSDEEYDYVFNVAEALGATHTTLELPTDAAVLKRIGDFAMKRKIYAAYHTHQQGNLTAFDQAFALSPGNMANVDFGHYVSAGSGDPVIFLEKFHARIASFHLKDRQTPANGGGNLAWGTGDTPIQRILQTVRKNGYRMPATIELEYAVPEGSDAVAEVKKCVEFCRKALA